MRPLYSHQCSADHLLDKLQLGLNVQFFNLSSCAECWFFAKKIPQWWCGLGLVLTLGPAWLWVNNLLAAIWFDGLPLIRIYGVGTRAKGAPHLQQGNLTPIPVPCSTILHCYYERRVSLHPATRNVTRHCLTPVQCFASPFQSSLLIMFVWKCLKWL